MANFTLQLTVGVAKGATASWYYVSNSVGHSYGNPVDVQIGDTVTFTRAAFSNGTAKVRLLNIFTNNADIDLTSSSPTVVRTVASGGTTVDYISGLNQGENRTDSFFLERQAAVSITAPTASSVTFNNPASANTTATVNLSASGSGGTLQYACEVGDSTPDNWQSGSTFTVSRGSGTVYARARRSSTTNSNVVSATRPPFLIGDTGVNPSNSTIVWNDTSETTTVAFGTAGETYAVRLNNGSTNLGAALAPAGSPSTISISFSTSLPTAGNTTTYEIFVRRPTSTGGDGSTYHATNDTFTVTRSVQPADRTPNAFNLQNPGTATPGTLATSVAQQITGMDSGTPCSVSGQGSPQLQVGGGNNAWVTSSTINPNFYINVRLTASTSFNTTHTATLTIGTGTDTIAVTSSADTSGGSSTGVAGGSGSHGIQVFDINGSTSVLSPGTRYMTRLVDPVSISITAGNSTLISCVMTGLTTSNSQVVFEGYMPVSQVPVTLESNGFRITNNSSQTISNVVYVTRF